MKSPRYYRLRVRDALDSADALVLTSVPGGTNPYITEPPSGDGQSIEPITGKPTTGAYSVRVADPVPDPLTAPNTRPVTSVLADANARQQLIARKAYVETSDGASWVALVVGYVVAVRLISAIEYEIAIGQSRRIEQSREIFKTATTSFPSTTSVIGGPIFGGFSTLVDDNGGWRMKVTQIHAAPNYIQIKLVNGFDPRKFYLGAPYDSFASASQAITDYENNYARPYFEPFLPTSLFVTVSDIQGQFPQMRTMLIPVTNPSDPTLLFVPLSEPDPIANQWWSPSRVYDNLTRSGVSSLWIPYDAVDAATGAAVVFSPAIDDEFDVYVYAIPVNKDNPLHIFLHPVDLWEALMIDAGIDYDATPLAALRTALGDDLMLALRITQSYKLADFLERVIYGPFRLSTRIEDGKQVLFSIKVRGAVAAETVVLSDLRSDEGTVFNIEESTVVTALTLKSLRLYPWSTDEKDQPEADSLIAISLPVQTIENSDDDIPAGTEREVTIGDIPGMIARDGTGVEPAGPVNFNQFLANAGDEMFQRFGRGAISSELSCLPRITAKVGECATLDLPHMPVAVAGQSPVSQRSGTRKFQITQRTEVPEGSVLKLVDATVTDASDTGAGGGSEEETDVTAAIAPTPTAFPSGYGARADWPDSYPQFGVRISWEGHAPSETTFEELYGGISDLIQGTVSHFQADVGLGWTVRCKIRYFDFSGVSAWSSYSNEVTQGGSAPPAPTDVPTALVATSTVTDEAHGAWTDPSGVLQIRINWQASTEVSSPTTWLNVAGGNRLLAAATVDDDQPTGAGTFARFRLAYVNSVGVAGPYTDWSAYTAIAP